MGRVKVDIRDFKNFEKKLNKLSEQLVDGLMLEMVQKLSAEFLQKVIDRTPVGNYKNKQGGELRDGWSIGDVKKIDNGYEIEIYNNVEYAPYVEFGHRIVGKNGSVKGWRTGKFMMSVTEIEMASKAPEILEQMVDRFLKKVL